MNQAIIGEILFVRRNGSSARRPGCGGWSGSLLQTLVEWRAVLGFIFKKAQYLLRAYAARLIEYAACIHKLTRNDLKAALHETPAFGRSS